MALTKAQKQKILEELKDKITRQKAIVFADFTGLKVKDLSFLRKKMKKNGCELKVAKKTLISLALKESGINADLKKLQGEIALGFSYQDEIIPFKIFYDFSKENEKLQILAGLINKELIGKEKAMDLARLPSREELLSQLFFSAQFPLWGIFNSLQRNLAILKVRS